MFTFSSSYNFDMIEMTYSRHKLDYVVQIINYVYFVSREAVYAYDLHLLILRFRILPPPPCPTRLLHSG